MKKTLISLSILFVFITTKGQSPAYIWGKVLKSDSLVGCLDIEKDVSGNVYTVGYFNHTVDFDPGAGIYNLTATGLYDIYISKLDAAGNFVWARRMGGKYYGYGYAIAIDATGNVYAAGVYGGTIDFDPGAGIANKTAPLYTDAFIVKLDAGGNFKWVKTIEANNVGAIMSMTIDGKGNLFAAGYFSYKADFDPGTDSFMLNSTSQADIFIMKLNAAGNFKWAKVMNGSQFSYPYSIATDAKGNALTTGYFYGKIDFDPGPLTSNVTSSAGEDIFISKLDSLGNYLWAKGIGGTGSEVGHGLDIDASGNIYTIGSFDSKTDFDPGASTSNITPFGGSDVFILKLNEVGGFVWVKQIGGTLFDASSCIKLDGTGNIYFTGSFQGNADFDPGATIYNLQSAGKSDAFIAKLDASGGFAWTKRFGGTDDDAGYTIALDALNAIYTSGYFTGNVDFDPGVGVDTLRSNGAYSTYIHKLSQNISGIEENILDKNLLVYPNPGGDIFNILIPSNTNNLNLTHIEVYSSTGILVCKKSNFGIVCTIDLGEYANGLYVVKLLDDSRVVAILKLVKQ